MKRTIFLAVLTTALTILGLAGCGQTNKLQSITLSAGGNSGLFNLKGEGGTVQIVATGNYSNGKTRDLSNVVIYTVTPDGVDFFGAPLPAPPQTVTMSPTGLMTAVDPFDCTWVNQETDTTKPPIWALTGSYKVTAAFGGITSQPAYVGVASAVAGGVNNGACGP